MKNVAKYIHLFCMLIILGMACKPPQTALKRCGAVEDFNALIERDPSVRAKNDSIEVQIQDYFKRYNLLQRDEESLRGGRIIIPVVVHVLYNNSVTDPTNIPDEKINEQIDRLNADYRRLNTDAGSVPAAFAGVAADSRIEFQLCKRDPDCNPTTGITRTLVATVNYTAHDAKFTSTGGLDAWNTQKYLNIWVVPKLCIGGDCSYLGASSFPADPQNQHGYVVAYQYMGNTRDAHYNLGRTATHEFGHFYNLNHIWGDDCGMGNGTCNSPGECAGTDHVDDTPNQGEMNYNSPVFPLTDCCSPTNPGVMFMNYMDYVDDPAMFMFTQGQVDRMVATLYTTMSGLLSSDALIPPPATSTADLFIGDTPEDIGNEPNNESDNFTISQDIWVRNANDGLMDMEHQNPVYRGPGSPNYVYVRIRNRGCQTSGSESVKLYWAKASTGLGWPDPWNGGIFSSGALMGNLVAAKTTGAIAGDSSTILEYEWTPPNPADYSSFGADKSHFCLLARIEPPSVTESSDLWTNVQNNNNIAWKNIEIATLEGGRKQASTLLANYNRDNRQFSISFSVPQKEESVFNNYDSIFVQLNPKTFETWKATGSPGRGIVADQSGRIRLLDSSASIDGITLGYKEVSLITLVFTGDRKRKGPHVYLLDVLQNSESKSSGDYRNPVGAQRILIKTFNP